MFQCTDLREITLKLWTYAYYTKPIFHLVLTPCSSPHILTICTRYSILQYAEGLNPNLMQVHSEVSPIKFNGNFYQEMCAKDRGPGFISFSDSWLLI